MYIYIYIYIYIYLCTYKRIYVSYIYMCIHMYALWTPVIQPAMDILITPGIVVIYIFTHIYIYTHTHVYIYIYIYTCGLWFKFRASGSRVFCLVVRDVTLYSFLNLDPLF